MASNTVVIPPPDLPDLYPEQHVALFDERRYVVIEASTKSGKTAGCVVWLILKGWNGRKDGKYAWMCYTNPRAVDPGLETMVRILSSWDINRVHWKHHIQAQTIELCPNGVKHCEFKFFGAENPDSVFGPEYDAAVVDEASRCREDSWFALRSTLTTYSAPVRIIGNVKGMSNWMYRMGERGRSTDQRDSEVGYHRITSYDAAKYGKDKPGGFMPITYAEIADAERSLPPPVFRELYLAEPTDTASAFFRSSVLESFRGGCYEPTRYSWEPKSKILVFDPSGPWRIWRHCRGLPSYLRRLMPNGKIDPKPFDPVNVAHGPFAAGIDLSYGSGQSNSVIAIADRKDMSIVAEYADPNTLPHDLAVQAAGVCEHVFDTALVCWEVNGPGEGWHRTMLKMDYTRLYQLRREDAKGDKKTRNYGWRSNRDRKRSRLQQLHRSMAIGEIKVYSDQFLDEAGRYIVYEDDSIGPDLMEDSTTGARQSHGDRVIAYMLSLFAAQEMTPSTTLKKGGTSWQTHNMWVNMDSMGDIGDTYQEEPIFTCDLENRRSLR